MTRHGLPPTNSIKPELDSWKEIAAYLDVNVRTAQIWEKERGLPVRRLPGNHGRVFARVDEIESWRTNDGNGHAVRASAVDHERQSEVLGEIAAHPTRDTRSQPSPSQLGGWKVRVQRGLLAAALLATALAIGYLVRAGRGGNELAPQTVPLTTDSGTEALPDLSPDGSEVVFLRFETNSEEAQVVVQSIDSGARRVLGTTLPYGFPRWSPDGRWIAFMRPGREGVELALVSANGGIPNVIAHLTGRERQSNALDALTISWMKDGSSIAISDRRGGDEQLSLFQVSVVSGARSKLTSPPPGIPGDTQPAFSPDERWLAFVRQQTFSEADLYLMPVSGGPLKRLTEDNARIDGLTWLPDSSAIVFASNRVLGLTTLWQLDLEGNHSPKALTGGVGTFNYPSSARLLRNGAVSLVYQFQIRDSNIWRASIDGGVKNAVSLSHSTWQDYNPQFSFDGEKVAFISRRSGFTEVWVCDKDGTNARQVTSLKRGFTDSPRWSPDGCWITFTSPQGANRDVYIVPGAGGDARAVAAGPSEEGRPSFSHDSRWLYFRSDRTGKRQLWKVRVEGGTPIQLTQEGGYESFESFDGSRLYYVRDREHPALWEVPTSGGTEQHLLDGVWESRWAVAREAIYFQAFPGRELRRYDLKTRQVTTVGSLGDGRLVEGGLSVLSGGEAVAWTQLDQFTVDLVHLRLPGRE